MAEVSTCQTQMVLDSKIIHAEGMQCWRRALITGTPQRRSSLLIDRGDPAGASPQLGLGQPYDLNPTQPPAAERTRIVR